MDNQSRLDKLAAITVALLLILTAWGNAVVMFIVASLGLVVFVLISQKNITRGGALAAAVGFALAIGISLVTLFP
jgi:hypothetical protein